MEINNHQVVVAEELALLPVYEETIVNLLIALRREITLRVGVRSDDGQEVCNFKSFEMRYSGSDKNGRVYLYINLEFEINKQDGSNYSIKRSVSFARCDKDTGFHECNLRYCSHTEQERVERLIWPNPELPTHSDYIINAIYHKLHEVCSKDMEISSERGMQIAKLTNFTVNLKSRTESEYVIFYFTFAVDDEENEKYEISKTSNMVAVSGDYFFHDCTSYECNHKLEDRKIFQIK